MKKLITGGVTFVLALTGFAGLAHAQMMYGNYSNGYGPGMMDAYATSSETTTTGGDSGATGAALWQQLRSGAVSCASLTDDDFDALGDYFMGQMMGSAHEYADQQMTSAIGAAGDRQMHIAMGERLSGCNASAAYPSGISGFYPMVGGWSGPTGGWGVMNGWFGNGGYGYGYNPLAWIGEALLWLFAIIGVITFVRWLVRQGDRQRHDR